MQRIRLSRRRRRALVKWARKEREPGLLARALAVASFASGLAVREVCAAQFCARSFVYRTVARYREGGREALRDRRVRNGRRKVDGDFRAGVQELLRVTPREYGFVRSTWTRELLAIVMQNEGFTRVSVSTMGRVLTSIRARRGRPKPIVKCPFSERHKRRRLRQLQDLVEHCPENEVVVYEDEVDIHLNPKIGLDWMNRGEQKLVMTPGQNAKAYVAGALDAHSREVTWVGGGKKNSRLFIELLAVLDARYDEASVIHVILDNYIIHKSRETLSALARHPRIRLHFLPPYCPDHNAIERLWLDLHAQVTRNHPHSDLAALCAEVARALDAVSPWIPGQRPLLLEAA